MVQEVILQEKVICHYIPVIHSAQLNQTNGEKHQNVIPWTWYICKNFLMERKNKNQYKIFCK